MNHEEMADLLHDYARGKLSDEKRLIVERALEKDPGLHTELKNVCAYYGDLMSMPEIKAPRDFLSKVRERIERPGVLGQLRDILFFPLHIKLPIEIMSTVAVSLLVIIIYNPFAPKVPMQEQFAVRGTPEISSEAPAPQTKENDERVRHVDNLTAREVVPEKSGKADRRTAPAKKIPAPVRPSGPRAGLTASQTNDLASAAPSKRAAEKPVMGGSGVSAQYSIAEMSKSKAAAWPRLSASKPSAFADGQPEDVFAGGKADVSSSAPIAMSLPSASGALLAEAPASAPASPFAGLSDKELGPKPPAPAKAAEAPREEAQVAYNWVPASSSGYKSSLKYGASEIAQAEPRAEKDLRSKRSEPSPAWEESQVSGQVSMNNKLKSVNLDYFKSNVIRAGGTLAVLNNDGSNFRIKIPAGNFQKFENSLNGKGFFSNTLPSKPIDLRRFSSRDSIELIVTIIER